MDENLQKRFSIFFFFSQRTKLKCCWWGRLLVGGPDCQPSPPRELTDCRQLDDFQRLQNKTLAVRPSTRRPADLNLVWIWPSIFRFRGDHGGIHQLVSCPAFLDPQLSLHVGGGICESDFWCVTYCMLIFLKVGKEMLLRRQHADFWLDYVH